MNYPTQVFPDCPHDSLLLLPSPQHNWIQYGNQIQFCLETEFVYINQTQTSTRNLKKEEIQ